MIFIFLILAGCSLPENSPHNSQLLSTFSTTCLNGCPAGLATLEINGDDAKCYCDRNEDEGAKD